MLNSLILEGYLAFSRDKRFVSAVRADELILPSVFGEMSAEPAQSAPWWLTAVPSWCSAQPQGVFGGFGGKQQRGRSTRTLRAGLPKWNCLGWSLASDAWPPELRQITYLLCTLFVSCGKES